MPIFINGEVAKISLAQLIAEGKEIVERENIPASKFFDPDLSAASLLNLFRDRMKVGQNADAQVNGSVKQWQ